MTKTRILRPRLALAIAALMVLSVSSVTASSPPNAAMPVGPVTANILALNYDESGMVNGFVVSTGIVLAFPAAACSGIGTLGAVGNSVTYSGAEETLGSGLKVVNVSSFTNNTTPATYPPGPNPKPVAYPLIAGIVTALNYSLETGLVNGFLFTPSGGSVVLVDIGDFTSSSLRAALSVGTSVSVEGVLLQPGTCAPAGTTSEIVASSVKIGAKVYPIQNSL